MNFDDTSVAAYVVDRFGGLTKCAQALGRPISTVQKWQQTGAIPMTHWPDIEAAALKERWLDLSARWLGEMHAAQEVYRQRQRARAAKKKPQTIEETA